MAQGHLDRLSSIDAGFLTQESPNTHMHIGGLALFEGDPPAIGDLLDHIRSRLHLVPRYRQKLAFPPLGTGLRQGRIPELLPVARDEVQAVLDRREELLVRRGLPVEDEHGAHVHVGPALLQRQERRVEPAEAVGVGHGTRIVAAPCLRRNP